MGSPVYFFAAWGAAGDGAAPATDWLGSTASATGTATGAGLAAGGAGGGGGEAGAGAGTAWSSVLAVARGEASEPASPVSDCGSGIEPESTVTAGAENMG